MPHPPQSVTRESTFMERPYRWLGIIPPIGMLGGIPFANRVYPLVLGLPFLLAWIVAWVILTSATNFVIWRLDTARDEADGDSAAAAISAE
jgi:hypothetical protein